MERKETKILKPKKEGFASKLFNGKNRYLVMFLLIIPFLIAIGVFGFIAYRETKNIMNFASGETVTKDENIIKSMNYVLRDNATDLQKEYFAELKKAVEGPFVEGEAQPDGTTIAGLVGQNYVADFYTWTNKQGQFDIGGLNYIFNGRYENNDHFRQNVFQAARDGFYKYLSSYISQYGADKLIEVENVELTKCQKAPWQFLINEHIKYEQDSEGEWIDIRGDVKYDAYLVSCKWTYKEGSSLDISKFPTSINLLVIDRDGVYYIIEASESEIHERTKTQIEDSQSSEEGENTN